METARRKSILNIRMAEIQSRQVDEIIPTECDKKSQMSQ